MLVPTVSSHKLKELGQQARHLNIFPIFLDHYLPRDPENPVSSLFADLVEDCTSALASFQDEEVQALVDSIPPGIRSLVGPRDSSPSEEVYLRRASTYHVISLVQAEYLSFPDIIGTTEKRSIPLAAYPELKSKIDDEGLLVIDESFLPYDGGIEYKGHILHYHQLLRRGFTSNPNFDFLGRLVGYYRQSRAANRFAVAIDHTRLMPKQFFLQLAEFDRWFGPRFDVSKLDDPHALGLTVHTRTRPSIFDLTNKIDRTEFFWTHRQGIKSLEIEEISAADYMFGAYNINRYVHSERDISAHVLRHLDGAAKVYTADSYALRLSSQIPNEPRAFRKRKLFRIDGDISVEVWLDLIAHFFKSNEMILEYFDPDTFQRAFGEKMRQFRALEG